MYEFKLQHRGVVYNVDVHDDATVRLERHNAAANGDDAAAWLSATLSDRQLVSIDGGSREVQRRGETVWLPISNELLDTLVPAVLKGLLRHQRRLTGMAEARRRTADNRGSRLRESAEQAFGATNADEVARIDTATAKVAAAELKLRHAREQLLRARRQHPRADTYIRLRDNAASHTRTQQRTELMLAELDKLTQPAPETPGPAISTVDLPDLGMGLAAL